MALNAGLSAANAIAQNKPIGGQTGLALGQQVGPDLSILDAGVDHAPWEIRLFETMANGAKSSSSRQIFYDAAADGKTPDQVVAERQRQVQIEQGEAMKAGILQEIQKLVTDNQHLGDEEWNALSQQIVEQLQSRPPMPDPRQPELPNMAQAGAGLLGAVLDPSHAATYAAIPFQSNAAEAERMSRQDMMQWQNQLEEQNQKVKSLQVAMQQVEAARDISDARRQRIMSVLNLKLQDANSNLEKLYAQQDKAELAGLKGESEIVKQLVKTVQDPAIDGADRARAAKTLYDSDPVRFMAFGPDAQSELAQMKGTKRMDSEANSAYKGAQTKKTLAILPAELENMQSLIRSRDTKNQIDMKVLENWDSDHALKVKKVYADLWAIHDASKRGWQGLSLQQARQKWQEAKYERDEVKKQAELAKKEEQSNAAKSADIDKLIRGLQQRIDENKGDANMADTVAEWERQLSAAQSERAKSQGPSGLAAALSFIANDMSQILGKTNPDHLAAKTQASQISGVIGGNRYTLTPK